jgi:hypothetical protein
MPLDAATSKLLLTVGLAEARRSRYSYAPGFDTIRS